MTSLSAIASDFMAGSRSKALNAALAKGHTRACAHSLAGSSAAMLLASLANRPSPLLVIGDSLDDAGYLYHDLSRLLGEEAVLILPSGYKRAIKYGQPDPPSQILRTEALSAWQSASSPVKIVVTYPEALAEKVAPPQMLAEHTLRLSLNSPVDLTEVIKWLRNNNFSEVDYVYEPGHFAHRGSILDIFGYSHELPYRIDFFGDEIDSIRTFNIETQLSEEKLDSVSITANVAQTPTAPRCLSSSPPTL